VNKPLTHEERLALKWDAFALFGAHVGDAVEDSFWIARIEDRLLHYVRADPELGFRVATEIVSEDEYLATLYNPRGKFFAATSSSPDGAFLLAVQNLLENSEESVLRMLRDFNP
jgi:hypothetical protein